MKLEGAYTFNAPRELVWSLIHDPGSIQGALPGCEHFHQRGDGKYHVVLSMESGPFRGSYDGYITLVEETPYETFSLSMTGTGGDNAIAGMGSLTLLEEDPGRTKLLYEGDVEATGPVPAQSPRLTRTTANYLIRSFMEALDQQATILSGTAGSNGLPPAEVIAAERRTPTIGMQDFLAELKRDRWVAIIVLLLALLAVFSVLGVVFAGLIVAHWVTRKLAERRSQDDLSGDRLTGDQP